MKNYLRYLKTEPFKLFLVIVGNLFTLAAILIFTIQNVEYGWIVSFFVYTLIVNIWAVFNFVFFNEFKGYDMYVTYYIDGVPGRFNLGGTYTAKVLSEEDGFFYVMASYGLDKIPVKDKDVKISFK